MWGKLTSVGQVGDKDPRKWMEESHLIRVGVWRLTYSSLNGELVASTEADHQVKGKVGLLPPEFSTKFLWTRGKFKNGVDKS